MPVCIAGMHRSGTSMVARLLGACGIYIGEENDLRRAESDNPEGYWENSSFVALNDAILGELGGGWDLPPSVSEGWELAPALDPLVHEGVALAEQHRSREPWGWKDPRNCLTYPFWRRIVPDARAVICVRNPLEVAHSLGRRNGFSIAAGLHLWLAYMETMLRSVPPEERIVTHYDCYFFAPQRELRRVVRRLGLHVEDAVVDAAVISISQTLRHHDATSADLDASSAPRAVVDCYAHLCAAAGSVYREMAADATTPSGTWLGPGGCAGALYRDARRETEPASTPSGGEEALRSLADRLFAREAELSDRELLLDVREAQLSEIARDLSSRLEATRRAAESLAAEAASRDAAIADLSARADVAECTVRHLAAQHDRFAASLAGRLLQRYGRLKYRYLLPLYHRARSPIASASLSGNESDVR